MDEIKKPTSIPPPVVNTNRPDTTYVTKKYDGTILVFPFVPLIILVTAFITYIITKRLN